MPTQHYTRAATLPQSLDPSTRSVTVCWTSGQRVQRYDWSRDRSYLEELPAAAADLTRLNSGASVLSDHDNRIESVIGVVERAWIEGELGYAELRFSARPEVEPLFADIAAGILRHVSVGYQVGFVEVVEETDQPLPVYRATSWLPMEISLVAVPADGAAQIRSNSGDPKMPDQTQKPETAQPVDMAALERQATETERHRITAIRSFAATSRAPAELVERLIADGTPLAAAKEQIIDAWSRIVDSETSRAHVAEVRVTGDESTQKRTQIVDALLGRAGLLPVAERAAKMQGNPYASRKLLDIARESLERAGERVEYLSQMEIVGRAFTQSTSDFPVLLENTLHKSLLTSYASVAQSWKRFCKTGSVSDFRSWSRIKTGSIGTLDAVNELGEFVNKTIPDGEAERVQATTRGNIVNISRQAIINDDLGYFAGLSADLGRAAARTIESAVYAKLTSNPTMSDGIALFHASHGNYTASGAAPSVANVDAARQAMAVQKDVGGKDYLDQRPAIAVVPVALGGALRVINAAEYDIDQGGDGTLNSMTPNRVRGLLNDIVDSPRIANTGAWYLFADPTTSPVMEVVFLDGNESPYLEVQNGFSVDGAAYKARLDFGVGVIDYRGAYLSIG